MKERIEGLFDVLMDKTTLFVKTKCQEYERIPETALAMSTLRMLRALLKEHVTEDQ